MREDEAGTDTVAGLLDWARVAMADADVDSPWLTALVLLEHTTGLGRESVLAHPDAVPPAGVPEFRAMVARRCRREPLAYILGYREFYGRRFNVSPSTLIPRPETEDLVDLAIEALEDLPSPLPNPPPQGGRGSVGNSPPQGRRGSDRQPPSVLEVGAGSGAIVVTLLAQRPLLTGVATDDHLDALQVARRNAEGIGVAGRLRLVVCNLADAISSTFPVVLANLPYVPTGEIARLEPEVRDFEPRTALDGGPDGTGVVASFIRSLPDVLRPAGVAIAEIGEGQAAPLAILAQRVLPGCTAEARADRTGADRFLVIRRGSDD